MRRSVPEKHRVEELKIMEMQNAELLLKPQASISYIIIYNIVTSVAVCNKPGAFCNKRALLCYTILHLCYKHLKPIDFFPHLLYHNNARKTCQII